MLITFVEREPFDTSSVGPVVVSSDCHNFSLES